MSTHGLRIGIDLGGTKIEGLVLADDGSERLRRRVPTPRGDYTATLDAVAGLVGALEQAVGRRCTVGIGGPGSVSRVTGLVKNSNSVCLNGRPLYADLEYRLQRPLRFANDADCFALSEAIDGAAAGAGIVFGVIVGTGTGGGIVVDGCLLSGPNGIAGEWGHNPLPWPQAGESPGVPCYCGRAGCIETWLSGPGLARDYHEMTGAGVSAAGIAARAAAGEADARTALARYADRMARALAGVINLLDPDVIVLGGGMSNIGLLYQAVPQRWEAYVFSDRVDTRLVRARHGDSSGVRGAARLWPLPQAAA
ncbi:MAG: ROK family protein [Gammaproteobacteria bacterium]|jgi:fructokinase